MGETVTKEDIKRMKKNNDEEVRQRAWDTFGKIGDKRSVGPLIQALRDNDNVV